MTQNDLSIQIFLSAVEEMWGFNLPKDYREFLLKTNGGQPEKPLFSFYEQDHGSCIDHFFGIKKSFNDNILLKQKNAGIRFPDNFLPIAREICGNLILLSVKNADRGKIYFWDHEMEADEGEIPDYSNLTLIANSFEEFIASLRDEEDL
jgi:hypothetical protein